MIRVKIIFLLVVTFTIYSSACAPGDQYAPPTDLTLMLGTDVPQQVATVTSDMFTQTLEPVTSTPVLDVATLPSSMSEIKPAKSATPSAVVVTVPPPTVEYNNSTVGYRLNLPGNWTINATDGSSKEVIFYPPNPKPLVAYLSINLDSRTLDQIVNLYAQSVSDAVREDTIFNGYPGIKYTYTYQNNVYRIEYYIPYGGQIFLIVTDRPNDGTIQSIVTTIQFTVPPQPVTYDATMADNGKTFVMNIGDKLKLNLDLGYIWSATSISNSAVIEGVQDGYFAFARGAATLSTIGNPECLNSTPPCLASSIVFMLTVIVR